ncbi:hypothetical protein EJP77_04930 [Paenibacillus zeisoli]|uniref:Uncharacterized protein n=1 Tax=Paenibacillus zeisoli TaxID=2496267 RepID=A0A433XQF5_9BACL|nr:hypothetical protein [Paenibacillus zeisoli]RUT36332.1 hypothetical protein EJP77_04930 [Paenibacillus zeisoli]
MPDVSKRLGKGIFGTASTTVYTVPASTTTFLKALTICNKTATDATVTLLLAGTEVIYQHKIKANDTITIPFLDQILNAGETITGLAGTASALTYYISGREVS